MLKNSHVKFHPDPIWNDEALGFLKSAPSPQNKNNKRKRTVYSHVFPNTDA